MGTLRSIDGGRDVADSALLCVGRAANFETLDESAMSVSGPKDGVYGSTAFL